MTLETKSAILPPGIRSRLIPDVNGLTMHILESGYESGERPCILLLHGFPELAFSWRNQMLVLADAGYHVVAPDQRGYGRTTGWSRDYDGDLSQFRFLNLVTDAIALVQALGYTTVSAVAGHDFGSPVAAWCALIRPDIFARVVLMSAPFGGVPATVSGGSNATQNSLPDLLAALSPPRQHYQFYFSTRGANKDMLTASAGLQKFLRGYYHVKSADYAQNQPYSLPGWDALGALPRYYVMDLGKTMPDTIAEMVNVDTLPTCDWLPDEALEVYAQEFARTGFQGGLQWYRCATDPIYTRELRVFAGRKIETPACFIAGSADWGIYQSPGQFERMEDGCTQFRGAHIIQGAGHWVQQEQPGAINALLLQFLASGRS